MMFSDETTDSWDQASVCRFLSVWSRTMQGTDHPAHVKMVKLADQLVAEIPRGKMPLSAGKVFIKNLMAEVFPLLEELKGQGLL